ncbi:MAG: flagellar hook capping FlgD N-terminal domain-containing protein [Verrucomicrobiota bacterium]
MSTPVSGVNGSNSSTGTTNGTVPTVPAGTEQTLSQADFLQIMVAQFTNQDPLSDSDGSGSNGTSDYVSELMSMTNLTTMQTMSQQQSMMLAGSLPGSTVVLSVNGNPVSGVVQGAEIQNATLYLNIGGQQYPASDLVSVTQTQAQADAAGANGANGSNGSERLGQLIQRHHADDPILLKKQKPKTPQDPQQTQPLRFLSEQPGNLPKAP